jgi:hypothetical protein
MAEDGVHLSQQLPYAPLREPPYVFIEVIDNGPGMDEKTLKRIFEPFFTTKEVGSGTGLGLSVSYFIVTEQHRGKLAVASKPGQGACFSIRLPVGREALIMTHWVLIVDDEEMIRENLKAYLEDEGLPVMAFELGNPGVGLARRGRSPVRCASWICVCRILTATQLFVSCTSFIPTWNF